jgi:hypothetical protein
MRVPVVQEETTGCAIAAVANILGKTYSDMKAIANGMGIYASDKALWSDTHYVRRMLANAGVQTSSSEEPFVACGVLQGSCRVSRVFKLLFSLPAGPSLG